MPPRPLRRASRPRLRVRRPRSLHHSRATRRKPWHRLRPGSRVTSRALLGLKRPSRPTPAPTQPRRLRSARSPTCAVRCGCGRAASSTPRRARDRRSASATSTPVAASRRPPGRMRLRLAETPIAVRPRRSGCARLRSRCMPRQHRACRSRARARMRSRRLRQGPPRTRPTPRAPWPPIGPRNRFRLGRTTGMTSRCRCGGPRSWRWPRCLL
jgi:hypothetical protein